MEPNEAITTTRKEIGPITGEAHETATLTVEPGTLMTILAAARLCLEHYETMSPVLDAVVSAMNDLATLYNRDPVLLYRNERVLITDTEGLDENDND